MNRLGRRIVILAAVAILLAGVGRAEAETLLINQFAGTFDQISLLDGGSSFKLLGGRITVTAPADPLPEQLTIEDLVVDLTGYGFNGAEVGIDSLVVKNPSNDTSASFAVDSAYLTQWLPNSPIGAGYISLTLSPLISTLKTDAGNETIDLDVVDSVITFNGLEVTPSQQGNGTASLGTFSSASASITALVPEPSTLVLALFAVVGCSGFCWRRRARLFL